MDNRTEQLADGVWRVEVALFVNAYVLADDGAGDAAGLTLVDTGTAACGPRLVRSIRLAGLDPRAVHRVLLTHWHADHAGAAERFASSSAAPRVHAGAADLPVITGRAEPAPPADAGPLRRFAQRRFPTPPPVPAAEPLFDDERYDVAGGLEIVACPGHTPGSVACWLPARGVILAGDAIFCVPRPSRGPRVLCSDTAQATTSRRRLAGLPVEVVAAGHGPPVLRDGQQVLARLAQR